MAVVANASVPLSLRAVAVLAAAAFLVSLGYGALMPVVPGWLSALRPSLATASVARDVGELAGIYMLGVFVGALAAGYASDALGRRPVLLCGLVVFVLSQIALVHVDGTMAIYGLRFLAGVAGAAVIPIGSALIAERSPKEHVPQRLTALGAASLVGFLVGPGLVSLARWLQAGTSLGRGDPTALLAFVMHAMAALGTFALIAIWRIDLGRPSVEGASEFATTSTWRRVPVILLALNFATLLGLAGFEVAVALHGSQRLQLDPLQLGVMFAECSLVMLLVNGILLLTPLRRLLRVRPALLAGLAAMAAGFLLLLRGTDYAWSLAGVGVVAAGSGLAIPMITWAVASATAPLGTTMGQLTAAGSLGQALGSVAGGWAFGAFSADSFLIGALFMALTLLFAWVAGAAALAMAAPSVPTAPPPRLS
jgi:predicted MFS family arabinose efflux permease